MSKPAATNNPASQKIQLAIVSGEPDKEQQINKGGLEGTYTGTKIAVDNIPAINPDEKPTRKLEANKVYLGKQTKDDAETVYYYITNGMDNWAKIDNDTFSGNFTNGFFMEAYNNPEAKKPVEEENTTGEGKPAEGETPNIKLDVHNEPGANPIEVATIPSEGANPSTATANPSTATANPSTAVAKNINQGVIAQSSNIIGQSGTNNLTNLSGINTSRTAQEAPQEEAQNLSQEEANKPAQESVSNITAQEVAQTEQIEKAAATNPHEQTPAINPEQGGGSRRKRKYSFKSKKQIKNKLVKRTMKK
jgi:hypothetical protein